MASHKVKVQITKEGVSNIEQSRSHRNTTSTLFTSQMYVNISLLPALEELTLALYQCGQVQGQVQLE